jgi:hypothetical protein
LISTSGELTLCPHGTGGLGLSTDWQYTLRRILEEKNMSLRYTVFRPILMICLVIASAAVIADAQTTVFTYQGRLTDGALAANGSYDFQFALFDQLAGGSQQPQPGPITLTKTSVTVTNGIFTVTLDFGVSALNGNDRYLDISVKKSADPTYQPLIPRQQLTSSPYAVQTLNASQLGGVPANQFVQTTDARLTDARPASSVDFGTATLNNVLPIPNGGTGSNTKNFVDLSTTQTVTGAKTFSSASNVFKGDGTGLTLGQSAVSVFGTTGVTITPTTGFTLIPGLTQIVTVPAGAVVQINSTGGLATTSGSATGFSIIDVVIVIDSALPVNAGYQRVMAANTGGIVSIIKYWSLQIDLPLPAGAHTIQVFAAGNPGVGSNAIVGGDTTSVLQGTLSVAMIKQ